VARAVHHVDLVVRSLERSHAFYLGLLAPLGWSAGGTITGERGELVRYLHGPDGGHVGLRERPDDVPQRDPDRYALGLHHLAFAAASREAVDERAAFLAARGDRVTDAPRDHPEYGPGYYAVFFLDPDGLKLELAYTPAR
jgi:catechol 2,3-dioxygenase-like lactoylglutathione lyase family enzyme